MNRGVGVLIGLVVGWVATIVFNFGSSRLVRLRVQRFDTNLGEALMWTAVIAASAALIGVLGLFARQLPGGLFGAGLFMTGIGLVLTVAPVRFAFDVSRTVIDVLDKRSYGAVAFDGTLIFVGVALMAAGLSAFRSNQAGPQQLQQQPNAYYAAPPTPPPGQFPG